MPLAREQVIVHLLRAADIQDGVCFAIELLDLRFSGKPAVGKPGSIARAKCPAPLEAELPRQAVEQRAAKSKLLVKLSASGS